jgi:hypothetical protein
MTKSIFQFSTSEIDQIATKFKKALGLEKSPNTRQQASYSPLKCDFKVGSESIYDLSVVEQLEKIGVTPATWRQKEPKGQATARNLFVTTGAFEAKEIQTVLPSPTAKNVDGVKYFGLDGQNFLKIMNIFLDIDFKGEKLEKFHQGLLGAGQLNDEVKGWLEDELKVLERPDVFGQRPNVITISKNGFHFQYQLDITSGWSIKGIEYLHNLKDTKGLDIRAIEEQAGQVRAWMDKLYSSVLEKQGYDTAVRDVGSRKTREIGMWHTKDLNNPFLLVPCQGIALSTKPLQIKTDIKAKEEATKKLVEDIRVESISQKKPKEYLTGDEIVTVGLSGKKALVTDQRQITVKELKDNFDDIVAEYGSKKDVVQVCADWLSPRVARPYESIGGAIATKGEDGAILIHVVHSMKPQNDKGEEVKLFILPTQAFTQRVNRQTQAKALNLSLDRHGKPEKIMANLRLILENDQFVGDFYKYDVLRHAPCTHQSIASRGWYHETSYTFQGIEQSLRARAGKTPFSSMEAVIFSDHDTLILQHYLKEKYDVEFPEPWIMQNMGMCLKARGLIYNTISEGYQERYKQWVQAGKPEVLDIWLPESLNVDKNLHPEYYKHLQLVGRKVLIGMTARAFSSYDQLKCEYILAILGKAQSTGKSTMANVLLNSIFGLPFSKSETTESKIVTHRFMLDTKTDDDKVGDKILKYAGKLVYLMEEWGADMSHKKSNNSLKSEISEASMEGRTAYAKDLTKLNFTHFIIATTNDKRVLHHGDGDQRRFLILDLDYVGSDGTYACVLGKKQKANDLIGNVGLIDNGKKMHDLLLLAWGEAYARTIKGELTHSIDPALIAQKNRKDVVSGRPIEGEFIHCEMPRLTRDQIAQIGQLNKTYEMRNDRIDDLLIDFFRRQGKTKVSYSLREIEAELKDGLGILKTAQPLYMALQTLDVPLTKVRKNSGNVWVMCDKSTGTLLTENPYAKIDDEQGVSATQALKADQDKNQEIARLYAQLEQARQAQAQAEIAAREAQAQAREAQLRASQAVQQAKELEAKGTEVVVLQSAPMDYGFTPELEEEDDDDQEFEIVVAQSPKAPQQEPKQEVKQEEIRSIIQNIGKQSKEQEMKHEQEPKPEVKQQVPQFLNSPLMKHLDLSKSPLDILRGK